MSFTPGIIFDIDETSTVGNLKLVSDTSGLLSNGEYLLVDNGSNTSEYLIDSVSSSTPSQTYVRISGVNVSARLCSDGDDHMIATQVNGAGAAITSTVYYSSNNGSTWSSTTLPSFSAQAGTDQSMRVIQFNGIWVIIHWYWNAFCHVYTSTNFGATWTKTGTFSGSTRGAISDLFIANNSTINFLYSGQIYTSSNGISWTNQATSGAPAGGSNPIPILSIAGSGTNFIMSNCQDGVLYKSTNGGVAWSTVSPPATINAASNTTPPWPTQFVAYDGTNFYVSCSQNNGATSSTQIIKTSDLSSYSIVTLPVALSGFYLVSNGTNKLLAVPTDSNVASYISSNGGSSWTSIGALGASGSISSVTASGNYYFVSEFNSASNNAPAYVFIVAYTTYTVASTTPSISVNVPTWVAKSGQRLQYSVDNGSLDFQDNAALTYTRQNNNIVYNGTPTTGLSGPNITLKAINLNIGDALYTFGVQYNISQN
jgi:hypothetical protein